jgi:uncharacterized membrane protein
MNKSQVKGIVIVAGTIVTFLLMRFLQIRHPIGSHFSGWVLSQSIIAALALIFGAIVGGAVGSLAELLMVFSQGFSPWSIPYILLSGFYGFVIGKIYENQIIGANNKNAISDLGFFSLLVMGLHIITGVISFVIFYLRFFRDTPLFDFIRSNSNFILSNGINGLIIGIISFLIVLIYHKCLMFDIPFSGVEKGTDEKL